jgi:hypothetical protein
VVTVDKAMMGINETAVALEVSLAPTEQAVMH